MRKRITYANVAATLALVFSMTGGAIAAKHYLINSTSQINPKVLKKLKGATGKKGATGNTGATGPQGTAGTNGKEGLQGKEGAPGTARAYAYTTGGAAPALETAWTKNFTAISHPATGVYCLTPAAGIDANASPPVASVDWGSSTAPERDFVEVRVRHLECAANQYEIHTFQGANSAGNLGVPAPSDAVAFSVIVP